MKKTSRSSALPLYADDHPAGKARPGGSTVTVCSITTGGWTMSCSTALSWGAALSSRATGASRAGLPVVRHRRLSGALSALSLSVWSSVDFWRIAARRPRSAGGILPAVVPGDASAGGVASPLSGVAARRAGAVWRGGLQRRPGPAEVPARQPRLRDPPLYKQYSEVCEPGGVQFIDFGSDPDFNNCVDGLVLVDLTYLKANRYQRYIGAHLGAQKSA